MSTDRRPHWLYDKAQRQIKRREDLADYERDYRREAGLPEGPLDLLDHVGLELALKTFELFMDRVLWGEGTGEMTGLLNAMKLATYDPRPPMEPSLTAHIEAIYQEATHWFEGGESPILKALRERQAQGASNYWGGHAVSWTDSEYVTDFTVNPDGTYIAGYAKTEVNLSREAMDLLANSLDRTLEYYGASEHADPRGFWMRCDVESDQGRDTDTQA